MKPTVPTIALIALVLVACASPTGKVAQERQPVRIGGLFALSGDGASWGVEEYHATQLAVDDANAQGGVNGSRIKLVVEDTQTKPRVAATAMQKLADDSIPALIGPTWDESAAVTAPIAEEREIVQVAPSIAEALELHQDYKYTYATFYSDMASSDILIKQMAKDGRRKVAVIYNLNTWAQFRRDIFITQAAAHNITVIEFPTQDQVVDFRTTILKIQGSDADAIYILFTSDESTQPFMKQASEAGLNLPAYTGSTTESEQVARWYSQYRPGVTHVFLKDSDEVKEFKQRYKAKYGAEPSQPSAAVAYDSAQLIIAAMRSGARTGPQIKRWLDDIQGFPALGRNITFDEHGWAGGDEPFVVKKAVNGTFVEISGGQT